MVKTYREINLAVSYAVNGEHGLPDLLTRGEETKEVKIYRKFKKKT